MLEAAVTIHRSSCPSEEDCLAVPRHIIRAYASRFLQNTIGLADWLARILPTGSQAEEADPGDVQRGKPSLGEDRHGIVLDPVGRKHYEFYRLTRTDKGWHADQASIFDLSSNKLRPDGWTSSDAAGLPILPAIVRHDEIKRGVIDHALRFTVRRSRRAYVYPATHFASKLTDENLPRMGERFRLRKDFDTSKLSPEVRVILEALKRYGMLMADNGMDWGLSVSGDERLPVFHEELRRVKGSDFEVVIPPPGYVAP